MKIRQSGKGLRKYADFDSSRRLSDSAPVLTPCSVRHSFDLLGCDAPVNQEQETSNTGNDDTPTRICDFERTPDCQRLDYERKEQPSVSDVIVFVNGNDNSNNDGEEGDDDEGDDVVVEVGGGDDDGNEESDENGSADVDQARMETAADFEEVNDENDDSGSDADGDGSHEDWLWCTYQSRNVIDANRQDDYRDCRKNEVFHARCPVKVLDLNDSTSVR